MLYISLLNYSSLMIDYLEENRKSSNIPVSTDLFELINFFFRVFFLCSWNI
jgi:hypothetical protein